VRALLECVRGDVSEWFEYGSNVEHCVECVKESYSGLFECGRWNVSEQHYVERIVQSRGIACWSLD